MTQTGSKECLITSRVVLPKSAASTRLDADAMAIIPHRRRACLTIDSAMERSLRVSITGLP
jgi:hypothetical protein